jgi:hypothetical protein
MLELMSALPSKADKELTEYDQVTLAQRLMYFKEFIGQERLAATLGRARLEWAYRMPRRFMFYRCFAVTCLSIDH